MHGVLKNIDHLCKRSRSKIWGDAGWKKVRRRSTRGPLIAQVVVCVVADGRKKVNSRTLSTLAAMGIYQCVRWIVRRNHASATTPCSRCSVLPQTGSSH